MSEDTLRAEQAARRAAVELEVTRRLAPKIAASGEALAEENQNNGFYMLVRHAMGIG